VAASVGKSRARYETGEVALTASVGSRASPWEMELSRGLRASANRAPPHLDKLRERSEHRPPVASWVEEKRAEAFFPLRATTTAADPKRDCASSKPKKAARAASPNNERGPLQV